MSSKSPSRCLFWGVLVGFFARVDRHPPRLDRLQTHARGVGHRARGATASVAAAATVVLPAGPDHHSTVTARSLHGHSTVTAVSAAGPGHHSRPRRVPLCMLLPRAPCPRPPLPPPRAVRLLDRSITAYAAGVLMEGVDPTTIILRLPWLVGSIVSKRKLGHCWHVLVCASGSIQPRVLHHG